MILPVRRRRVPGWRFLTEGEVAMASLLFKDAVDYRRVRIHRRRYMPFQPSNCAMTPNGAMYFHGSCFLDDFAVGTEHARHWFMHEMVHVWQHQLGYAVRARGAIRLGLPYHYDLDPGKTLADYNMEAQGDLLADFFVLRHLGSAASMRQRRYADSLALYQQVLGHFLAHPASRDNLPRDCGRLLTFFKRSTRHAP
ncbi:Rhs element Vgr protein [Massilia sp. PAMC28688]|uniref:Rhs element Vgr protein n=1 Tax=Massilia sp. PAMC28688 TaxID=2861283 RepID=UPI001C636DD9|nr:Rhs element Vgr protein [Massilia sp. PAMC28688]QYF92081.1 Rhs element Vgr protein [Massilia sp. PAMC28688]